MIRRGRYDADPGDGEAFTRSFDTFYSRIAPVYDLCARHLPPWKTWLCRALPYIRGPRVLEISFGTGYLLTRYARRFETHGIDYNAVMVRTARRNLQRAGAPAALARARVEAMPYRDQAFDTIVNTMAFSGYPDARQALAEMRRVLRPGGRLVLIDVNYPADGNWLGTAVTRMWRQAGDVIRDLPPLFDEIGFAVTDEPIGACGSVHLYLAERRG